MELFKWNKTKNLFWKVIVELFFRYPNTDNNAFEFWTSGSTSVFSINDNGNAFFTNQISCKFYTISNSGTDYIGVYANTGNGANGNYTMYIMFGTFTGFHRVFTEDENLIKETLKNSKMIM